MSWLACWTAGKTAVASRLIGDRHGLPFPPQCRLGPLCFNFGKSGLSSISLGGRRASFNIPVGHSGGTRTTVGLPGTG
jgi:hypothetical protein